MKTYLKHFTLTKEFVLYSLCKCLDPTARRKNRWQRRDTAYLIAEYTLKSGSKKENIHHVAARIYDDLMEDWQYVRNYAAPMIADYLYHEIKARTVYMKPIRETERYDKTCNKVRTIGIASMKQQVLDWICSEALDQFFNDKSHPGQESGIPYRGPLPAAKKAYRWIKRRDGSMNYCIQGDVQKFYPSIDHDVLKGIFQKYVRNEDILYLVFLIIDSYGEKGISIGSYLSLRMGNLVMGIAMHWLEQNAYRNTCRIRRDKISHLRVPLYSHIIVYTDNISIFGSNKSQVKKAMRLFVEYLNQMCKLTVKQPWIIRSLRNDGFYDIAGYKVYKDHVSIRKRTFKRLRNVSLRAKRKFEPNKANTIASYYGYIKHTNSFIFARKYKFFRSLKRAKEVQRNEAKSRVSREATRIPFIQFT
jgi:hypothetical protein